MIKMRNILRDEDQVGTAEADLRGANRHIDNIFPALPKANLNQLAVRDLLTRLMCAL